MARITNFEVLHRVEQPALSIRIKTSAANIPQVLAESNAKIIAHLGKDIEWLTDVPYVIYHDFESNIGAKVEIEIVFPLAKSVEGTADIKPITIPASRFVYCFFKGDYRKMAPLYDEMLMWIRDNNYETLGRCSEFYYSGEGFPVEDHLTKLMVPIR